MLFLLLVAGFAPTLLATPGEDPLDRFLAHDARQPHYRGTRHLEAENGKRRGWLAIGTEYAPDTGFRYHITAEGGSDYIRKKVLKAVLDGERAVVAAGEDTRSSLARINYNFQTKGIEDDGLAHVLLVPRRKERALVAGVMLLRPDQGSSCVSKAASPGTRRSGSGTSTSFGRTSASAVLSSLSPWIRRPTSGSSVRRRFE